MRQIWFTGMMLLFVTRIVAAQEENPPVYELQEIVVVSQRLFDPPHSYVEITKEEIHQRGATNLAEALDLIAGIDARTNSKGEVNFDLRGFGQRGVVLMIDGRPIYEPYFGTLDVAMIPVSNIEKIKVSRGPASSLYGPNAMAGVINIITRSAPNLAASLSYGSGDTRRALLQLGHAFKSMDFGVTLSHDQADGFPLPDNPRGASSETGDLRTNSDWRRTSADGRITFHFGDNSTLSLSAGTCEAEKGVAPQLGTVQPRYWRFPEWARHYADIAGTFALRERIKLRVKAYQDRYENTLVNYKTAAYREPTWESRYRNRVSGGHGYVDVHFSPRHLLTAGILVKEDRAKTQNDTGMPWRHFRARTYSGVVQDEYAPAPKVTLMVGTSYNKLHPFDAANVASFNPQAGLVYRPFAATSVHLLAGRKTRFPTLKEWHEANLEKIHLKPERTLSFDVGLRQTIGHAQIAGTFFHNQARDLINRKSRNSPFENIDRARLQGFEAEIQSPFARVLSARCQYVYLEAIDLATKASLDYRAKHRLLLTTDFKIRAPLLISLVANYTGKRHYSIQGTQKTLPATMTFDLHLVQMVRQDLKIILTGRNLTDKWYEEEAGFPMPGRTIQLGMQYGR
ncbi:MAG: TonB-dependent receptor [candidate division KSB1 bacterium]|nr:TonB-dependent receptor [candidate division KSB1 bacterium]MDZ7304863.1 TonB-dependent receptor [candidate division KSB1 bacterium]MDZ7314116.1 TonB-dependent receptor [candidate division KSB1 bacterium]